MYRQHADLHSKLVDRLIDTRCKGAHEFRPERKRERERERERAGIVPGDMIEWP